MSEPEQLYRIERCFADDRPREVRETHLTLEEAQEHCNDPATSGVDDKGVAWFDAYYEEPSR